MDIEKFIETITRKVIEELEKNKKEEKKILLLTSNKDEVKNKYSLFISKWEKVDFIYDDKISIDSYSIILCPELMNEDLIDIAIGKQNSIISSIIVEAILRGKKIICMEEGLLYKNFENSSNKNFYNIFEEYKKKLESYGIEFIKYTELGNIINSLENRENGIVPINRKVITESDIEKVWVDGINNIKISRSSIITPLAEDYIVDKQIKIEYLEP
ncbi:hypothetical protein [Clostridium sp. Cult2]|uniref:hypothetical protein n=1 Tax=Clostridium sp. Cult2 TaxID=2079003 RepID=UPI001F4147AE|nr:hypothetical protein [Clostridium sp. Cult2]MCF6466273.1 hypothetical protein [Clostridium sp. Cult2]